MMVNKYELSFQLLTCSVDQSLQFWDIRTIKGTIPGDHRREVVVKESCLTPHTFRHLDLSWKAFLKLSTVKDEMGEIFTPTKILIKSKVTEEHESTENSRSMIYLGTEEGIVLYMDWCPTKDQDSGKYQAQKPLSSHNVHNGPVVCLQRSPSMSDIVLSIGGWNFAIWKEGYHHGPIFLSGFCSKHYTGGCWSLTKPSVFFIMKTDGSLDVWDLLDRTHEPIHTQNISTTQITTIFATIQPKHLHLIAIGDSNGTLHLLELPSCLTLSSPTELSNMKAYMDTETKRTTYIRLRRIAREEGVSRVPSKRVNSTIKTKEAKKEVEEVVSETDEDLYNSFLLLESAFKEQIAIS